MTALTRRSGETVVLRIEGEMNIYRAAELKQTLLAALDGPDSVEFDLSAVTELDTAGVQLLLLVKRTARARNQELRFSAHSAAVVDVLELLNLGPHFGDALILSSSARHANGS